MKLNPVKSSFSLTLAVGLCLTAPFSSHAATRTKANNADNLNLTSSWVGGVVPTSSDVVLWDSTVTSANTVDLGATTNWAGIQILNPGGLVTINGPSGAYQLNLGASGIDMSSATADLTLAPTAANLPVGLTANQTWNIASGRTLTMTPNFALQNGRTLTLTNSGNFTTIGWMRVSAANSSGTFNHNGGTWSSGVAGANAMLFLGHSGTLGIAGVGIYNLNGGTIAMNGTQELRLGNQTASGDGTLNVTNGLITSSTTTTKLRVGYVDGGKGTYNQFGGTVTVGVMDVAANNTLGAGATGVATTSGGVLNVTTLNIGTLQNGSFTLTNSGRLNLSGTATVGGAAGSSGTLNLNGGTLNMASTSAALETNGVTGIVNANGVTITNGSSGNVTIAAPMTLGAGGITNVTLATSSGRNITYSGVLSGAGGIMVDIGGSNIVSLTGSNTYTGGVRIRNGVLESRTTQTTLGTGTVVMGGTGSSGATYRAGFGNTNAFTINAPDSGTNIISGNGAGAGFTLSGLVTLNGDLMVQSFFSSSLQSSKARPTLNGGINGTGNLILDNLSGGTNTITLGVNSINHNGSITAQGGSLGSNIISAVIGANVTNVTQNSTSCPLILSGANTYSGNTTVSAGTLQLGAAGVIPDGSGKGNVSVTGTLDLNTYSETINGLSGAGVVDTVAGGTPTLTVGGNNQTSTFSGVIKNTAGTLALLKLGAGLLTISSPNTYAGATTVSNGTLLVNGSLSSGAVTVQTNATLGGTGTIGGSVTFNVGAKALFTNGSVLTISGGVSLSTNVVHLNLSNNVPIGSYILATCASSSGTFSNTPTIVSGSLAANTHAVIITTSSNVVLQVVDNITATALALSSSSQTNGYHDNVIFTATVSPTNATGWVVFATNFVALKTNSLVAGVAVGSLNSLPRGTNLIIAIYSGDVNFLASTNTLEQIVTNHAPVANSVSYSREGSSVWHLSVNDLLTNAADVIDGDILTLVSVSESTNGATILAAGGYVNYYNSNPVDDQFSYTVTDGYGGTNTATITLAYGGGGAVTGSSSIAGITGSGVKALTAYGIPGETYITQRATNLDQVVWSDIATNTLIGTNVLISVTDSNPPPGEAYYRLKWQQP